jgi:hypothetical protein
MVMLKGLPEGPAPTIQYWLLELSPLTQPTANRSNNSRAVVSILIIRSPIYQQTVV